MTIPLTFVVRHRHHGRCRERRAELEQLALDAPGWSTSETFEDGDALLRAGCERGLKGVVAKRLDSRYGLAKRGQIKTKNPNCWRRDIERGRWPGRASG